MQCDHAESTLNSFACDFNRQNACLNQSQTPFEKAHFNYFKIPESELYQDPCTFEDFLHVRTLHPPTLKHERS